MHYYPSLWFGPKVEKTMEDVLFLSNEFKLPYVLFNSLYDHKLHRLPP